MSEESIVLGFLAAMLRLATPLLLAATGELITERGGVINLGIEGAMLSGALAAAIASSGAGPWAGVLAGVAAGAALAALFALITVHAGADQIITGTALTLGAVGLTGAVYREAFGTRGAGLSIPTLEPVGPAAFTQAPTTYLALALVPAAWWVLFRTRAGLALRAAGENGTAARAAGVRVRLVRTLGTVSGGALAGLAGASLVLGHVGTFTERMTAGRGFVAIAIVVLGRWRPAGVLAASLLFGGAMALQFLFQASGIAVAYQLFLMLPYVLALLGLAGVAGRVRAPGDLGKG